MVKRTENGVCWRFPVTNGVLRTPVELRGEQLTSVGEFRSLPERSPFILMYVQSHCRPPDPVDAEGLCGQPSSSGGGDERSPEHRAVRAVRCAFTDH